MYTGYIYKITNTVNDKVYIGATTNTVRNRFKRHIADSIYNDKVEQPKFHSDIKNFGDDKFKVEEILKISRDNVDSFNKEIIYFENYYIDLFDTIKNGYNSVYSTGISFKGGKNLTIQSEKVRKIMSDRLIGKSKSEYDLKIASESRRQHIICLNDRKIFSSSIECMEYYKVPLKLRAKVNRGLEDYSGLSFRHIDKSGNIMPIQQLKEKLYIKCSNGKIYRSIRDASSDIGTNHQCIHAVLSRKTHSSMLKTFQWCSLDDVEELLSNGYNLYFKN